MSVIVSIGGQKTIVTRGKSWQIDTLTLNVMDESKTVIASFRRWDSVHSPAEPVSAGPFQERDCTSPDCLKHNGRKSAADAVDWQHVLHCLQSPEVSPEMHAAVIVRALQQAQLYVMQRAP